MAVIGAALIAFVTLGAGCGDDGNEVDWGSRSASIALDASERADTSAEPRRSVDPTSGVATVSVDDSDGEAEMTIEAQLPPSGRGEAYEVWLYNSRDDVLSLGAQVTDEDGNLAGVAPLPDRAGEYEFVDVSRERIDDGPTHSGNSVLQGRGADSLLIGGSIALRPPREPVS